MSGFRRFFSGSTSKYVMENAECTVIVVKPIEKQIPTERTDKTQEAAYSPIPRDKQIKLRNQPHTHDYQLEEMTAE